MRPWPGAGPGRAPCRRCPRPGRSLRPRRPGRRRARHRSRGRAASQVPSHPRRWSCRSISLSSQDLGSRPSWSTRRAQPRINTAVSSVSKVGDLLQQHRFGFRVGVTEAERDIPQHGPDLGGPQRLQGHGQQGSGADDPGVTFQRVRFVAAQVGVGPQPGPGAPGPVGRRRSQWRSCVESGRPGSQNLRRNDSVRGDRTGLRAPR